MSPVSIFPATPEAIAQAARLLQEGKLVAFPTETVYGLGADATNDRAVAAIYAAKGRPHFNPLIIHVPSIAQLEPLIEWTETGKLLATTLWPGPLTLVLPRKAGCAVSLLASAGLDTLAVRIPAHPVAQNLLQQVSRPIAAPSANASGRLSPTTPMHVADSLGNKIDFILAGGKCQVGLESTVVDVSGARPSILRPGGITRERLANIVGPLAESAAASDGTLLAPGMMTSHYAPSLPLRLMATTAESDEAFVTFGPADFATGGTIRFNLSETGDLEEAAGNLFGTLRLADQTGLKGIAVMPIPEQGLGVAINDRLKRASVR